jgi:hypothetical protein
MCSGACSAVGSAELAVSAIAIGIIAMVTSPLSDIVATQCGSIRIVFVASTISAGPRTASPAPSAVSRWMDVGSQAPLA